MACEVRATSGATTGQTCPADPAQDPALAREARDLIDRSRRMGVLDTGLLERELGQVARHDPQHARQLFGQMLPERSTGDLHALSPAFKEPPLGRARWVCRARCSCSTPHHLGARSAP